MAMRAEREAHKWRAKRAGSEASAPRAKRIGLELTVHLMNQIFTKISKNILL